LVDVDVHNFGYVPIVRMANNPRTDNRNGYSEITPQLMSTIDSACRRLMGLEAASELYSVPRMLILGASAEDFQDANGAVRKAWDAYINKINFLENNEEGDSPSVTQLAVYDPSVFTKVIEMYAAQAAGQMNALPQDLGLYTQGNPPSVESVEAMELRRNARAETKQRMFGVAEVAVLQMALRFQNDGALPEKFRRVEVDWKPPAALSFTQAADAISKLVAQQVLPATSDVTLKRAGFSAIERQQLEQDRGPQVAQQIVATLQANAKAAQPPAPTSPEVNGGDTAAAGG
jgi:hypothetical protein